MGSVELKLRNAIWEVAKFTISRTLQLSSVHLPLWTFCLVTYVQLPAFKSLGCQTVCAWQDQSSLLCRDFI